MSTLDPDIVKAYEPIVDVRVIDLADEKDITHSIFEFSQNGIDWTLIEEDYNPGFEEFNLMEITETAQQTL